MSASMMTCTFAENRQLREEAPTVRSRTGINVPSTIHSRSTSATGRAAGSRASNGRRWWMTRQTVAGEIPKSGASCRMVRFVR
ncbi:hypothetical protein AMK29_20135 [Streptomyces sp. CB02261]|nr:hypothetical protein AMK29_20135 [Streptomyces sp. CB02261]